MTSNVLMGTLNPIDSLTHSELIDRRFGRLTIDQFIRRPSYLFRRIELN